LRSLVQGGLLWFTMTDDLPGPGVLVRDGWAVFRDKDGERPLFALDSLPLRGWHNQQNAVAAAAIAVAAGVSPEAIACAVEAFRGIPHRLEHVADLDGVAYYNDSIATTPERTVAGLRSFDEQVVLLLGGRDKKLPLEELVQEAGSRCRAVVLFGEAAELLENAFKMTGDSAVQVVRRNDLPGALAEAMKLAQAGDVVLLAPACTSYDAYRNFEERGEHFRRLVYEAKGVPPSQA
jgi:UDP-N-acetylmuramoylalanine--D-glutamate ligase